MNRSGLAQPAWNFETFLENVIVCSNYLSTELYKKANIEKRKYMTKPGLYKEQNNYDIILK